MQDLVLYIILYAWLCYSFDLPQGQSISLGFFLHVTRNSLHLPNLVTFQSHQSEGTQEYKASFPAFR